MFVFSDQRTDYILEILTIDRKMLKIELLFQELPKVVVNELKFGRQSCITKLKLCAKLKDSSSNALLTKTC